MRTAETAAGLASFSGRGAGTDAERRAALWLAGQLTAGRREAAIEPFWCRPNWALAQLWHLALGIGGSLLSVTHPKPGAALVLAAILCVIADWQLGDSPGRRLTRERASQNVVSHVPGATTGRRVRLIVTANYDVGRAGVAHRIGRSGAAARARSLLAGRAPGWVAWLVLALVVVLATALLRVEGNKGAAVAVAQLLATVVLVLAAALLLETAIADYSPGAADNATGVAAAIALALALDAAPPALSAIEVVLTGAGDVHGIGLRRHLRARRETYTRANTVVLGIGRCGAGSLRWWRSDGPLVPAAFFAPLRRLCAELPAQGAALVPPEHRGRGCSPAFPARMAGLPAVTIGAVDRAPSTDPPHGAVASQSPDPALLDGTVEAGIMLADALDGFLAALPPPAPRPG
jgi:hypothetical protein